jgi:hypothetical protein
MRPWMTLLPALMLACGQPQSHQLDEPELEPISIEGELDGERPELVDGFFVHATETWDDEDLIVVVLSSFEDSCEAMAELKEAQEDADEISDPETWAEAWAEAWEEHMPDEFWQIEIVMRIEDDGDSLGGQELDGVAWDEDLEETGEAFAVVRNHHQPFDFEYVFDDADREDYYALYYSDRGELQIEEHDPNDSLSGTFSFEVVEIEEDEDNPDEAGEVEVHFEVERCSDSEDYY